ncbi:hypothetical protein L7F22_017047 [Adiantum nelumboides]|nr:hypothetical protein [Adiantum nelumboides]
MALHEALKDGFVPSRANSPHLMNASSTEKVLVYTSCPGKIPFTCIEALSCPPKIDEFLLIGQHQGNDLGHLPNTFAEVTRQVHQEMFNPLYSVRDPFPTLRTYLFFDRVIVSGECSSHEQKSSGFKYNEGFWKENEGLDRMPIEDNSSQEKMPPGDSTQNIEEESDDLVIDRGALETWFDQLQDKVLIGLYHGPRPSMEALKSWVASNWKNKNIFPNHNQYLPNNYYLFFFYDNNSAFQVISRGQWIIRSTLLFFFRWHKGFDPRGDKLACIPIWVDFPDLPVEYYPWLKNIGAKLGKVLGQKSRGGINPKWDPALLIEVNLSKPLKTDISIKDSEGQFWHSQKVVYRNLPNSCFKCHAQGHQIKDCLELEKNKANMQQEGDKEKKGVFQQIPKKTFGKAGKAQKGNGFKSINRFEALLEDVFDPLDAGTSEMEPIYPKGTGRSVGLHFENPTNPTDPTQGSKGT